MPYSKKTITRLAIAAYQKGARTIDLARMYKVPRPTLWQWMSQNGCKFRPVGADRKAVFDEKEMVALYKMGASIQELGLKYQLSRNVITRRIEDAGIQRRSASQQAYISASKLTPEERLSRASAAHAAVRGSKVKLSVLRLMAIRRQHRRKMTEKEKIIYQMLAAADIITVPQYAVEKYTVDLAIPDARVAIEVETGWSLFGKKGEQRRAKEKRMAELGWITISLKGSKWRPGWSEKVKMYVSARLAMNLQ